MNHEVMLAGMDYRAFLAHRHHMASMTMSVMDYIDAAQTCLYEVLRQHDPVRFAQMAPSQSPQAGYRCHLAAKMCDYLGLSVDFSTRTLISQGVRDSLSCVFKSIKASGRAAPVRVLLPQDVYPVYQALAVEAGLGFDAYEARLGLPWNWLETGTNWCLLVCDPLKPWGGRLTAMQWDRLVDAARHNHGQILVDAAYDLSIDPAVRRHLDGDAPLAFMGSLSKGWLAPMCAGVVVCSSENASQWRPVFQASSKNEMALRRAYAALEEYRHRPQQVQQAVDNARLSMINRLSGIGIAVADPGQGYFLRIDQPTDALWERGVLGLPASVFGSPWEGTIFSALSQLRP